jgi:hypothetical protein
MMQIASGTGTKAGFLGPVGTSRLEYSRLEYSRGGLNRLG